jgi:hypothetical protein
MLSLKKNVYVWKCGDGAIFLNGDLKILDLPALGSF